MPQMDKPSIVYKKQVEAVENAAPDRLRGVVAAIAAATLTSFILGSNALLAWVNNLPIGHVSDLLLRLTQEWQDQMVKYGPSIFADGIASLLTALQSLQW